MAIVASGQMTLTDLNDARQLQLVLNASVIKTQIFDPTASTYTPDWTSTHPVITPSLFIAGNSSDIISQAKSITWNVDGTDITASTSNYTLASSGVKTLTINTNTLSSVNSTIIKCTVVYTDTLTGFDVTSLAVIEFSKVSNGAKGASGTNPLVAILSNDSVTLSADSTGAVASFANSGTDVQVYEGSTLLTFTTGTASNSQFTITPTATGVTAGAVTGSGTTKATYANITAMSTDTGSISFAIGGKTSTGGTISLTKVQNFAKSKTGGTGGSGTSPTQYWVNSSVSAISKNASGVYAPLTITASGFSQVGSGTPSAYSTWYRFSESTDGTTFTVKQTSSSNATSIVYPSSGSISTANLKSIKIEMFTAGGTTTLVDQQTIPVVSDGANSITVSAWTPQGNVIRNNTGTLTVECDVFNGSTPVSATTYKWYIQDGTATTSSGGDIDGGNGWRLLNATYNAGVTYYTTNTITVPASAIPSVESFKCVAIYGGIVYYDVATLIDVSDPISIVITGGNTFKNGQGTLSLTAKLYQGNIGEVDPNGTQYTYTWSLYNTTTNTLITPQYSTLTNTKTITVDARDVTGQANLICSIA